MIIGATTNKLCISHLWDIYYGNKAMEIVREHGNPDEIAQAEYIESKLLLEK